MTYTKNLHIIIGYVIYRKSGAHSQRHEVETNDQQALLLRLALRAVELLPGTEDDPLFDENALGMIPAVHAQLTELGLLGRGERFVGFSAPSSTVRIDPKATRGYPYVETGIKATVDGWTRKLFAQEFSEPTELVISTEAVPTLMAVMIAYSDNLDGLAGGGVEVQETDCVRLRDVVEQHLQQRNLRLPDVDLNHPRDLRVALCLTPMPTEAAQPSQWGF